MEQSNHRLLAEIMDTVARENERQDKRIYGFQYYGGKWFMVTVRKETFGEVREIIKKDTRVNERNLRDALEILAREVGE